MNSVSLKDPFSALPSEISVKIASYLPHTQISLNRRLCQLWSSILADKTLWADYISNFNWVVNDDPLIDKNLFEALNKNKRIVNNIDSLNFVSKDFFPCKSYERDIEKIDCYTVWNDSLVIRVNDDMAKYYVITDDRTLHPINFDKEDVITCMTVLNNQLMAAAESGEIYQLSTDLSLNSNPVLLYDCKDHIVYMAPFQNKLLVLTRRVNSDCLSLIGPNKAVIETTSQRVDHVRVFKGQILVVFDNQLSIFNDHLELVAANTIYNTSFESLDVLNNTIITTSLNTNLICDSYKKYLESNGPFNFTNAFCGNHSQLLMMHHRVMFIDSKTFSNPPKESHFYVYLRCYDVQNLILKSFKILSTEPVDVSSCKLFANQDKAYVLLGKKIMELDFNV
ncbi:MAG: F-box protein [Parachlamydiales bacterium]|nr:F-box protein [Parachlamydiales bacterium]